MVRGREQDGGVVFLEPACWWEVLPVFSAPTCLYWGRLSRSMRAGEKESHLHLRPRLISLYLIRCWSPTGSGVYFPRPWLLPSS